jgi:hypothetical protein
MDHLLTSFSAVSGSSQQLVNLASAFLGGSVAIFIGTTHVSPVNKTARLMYLILLACWGALAGSILYGDSVLRQYLAATVASDTDKIREIFQAANKTYSTQLNCLRLAMLFFGIWLVVYMLWWVFYRESSVGDTKP